MLPTTKPEVFVIESLGPDDEGNGRFEGSIISQMLNLHGKQCKYRYVRTRKHFIQAVKQFANSDYRYLHISCHADRRGMCTTNQDEIDHAELGQILRPHIRNKRLFLSACEMVNEYLVREIIPGSGCNSVVGPSVKVAFSDAAILWASFYHLMFSHSFRSMGHEALKKYLRRTSRMFQVDMSYFSKSKNIRGFSHNHLKKFDE
jgi:hypothetical protein